MRPRCVRPSPLPGTRLAATNFLTRYTGSARESGRPPDGEAARITQARHKGPRNPLRHS